MPLVAAVAGWTYVGVYLLLGQTSAGDACGVVLADRMVPIVSAALALVGALVVGWWNRPRYHDTDDEETPQRRQPAKRAKRAGRRA